MTILLLTKLHPTIMRLFREGRRTPLDAAWEIAEERGIVSLAEKMKLFDLLKDWKQQQAQKDERYLYDNG